MRKFALGLLGSPCINDVSLLLFGLFCPALPVKQAKTLPN